MQVKLSEGGQISRKINQVIACISNPPLTDQQIREQELISDRAPFCPRLETLAPKADEPIWDQRHKDIEGNEKPLH